MTRRTSDFQTIRSEGGLLPQDLLRRVIEPKESLPGAAPADYGLPPGERLGEAITQSWNRLTRHWAEFRAGAARLGPDEAGTGLTNDKWSLPLLRELGFGLLPTSLAPEVNGRTYAISRFSGPTPIHLVGCGVSLDRRAAGVRGAAAGNPHGLVQEFLNRSDGHLWAIVANGLRLRVLRDSQTLSRQSYLEFDLEAMFAGEVYADFVLLWMLAHATRFAPREAGGPETCWLEQWTKLAEEQGTRALGDLRAGVEKALLILGEGFVGHPRNTALREALRSGRLPLSEFHGQLLRVVYRLIFLFVAEDRRLEGIPALHPRDESEAGRLARERYAAHYGTGRLRELAASIRGSRHGDLWQQFNMLAGALAAAERFDAARTQLALPVLGSFLWAPSSTADLNASSLTGGEGAELANADLLEAVRDLAFTRPGKVLRPVDYRNLGSEELGSVYEGLLALTPHISGDGARFTFAEFAGNARKTSGSYYTPDSLVQCLLDSALDPVVEEATRGKAGAEAERALLDLKVCDPAVGSGHFLVGAAHRLARHLSRVRALAHGESEPSPLLYQQALRDVIGRCLYGVDLNPMAAELCRVSLWLEALEPGKPLSFLDHHIRVGNSLLGTTPELIAAGLPDEAFTPIEGDDKKACAVLKKRNRSEREGWGALFAQQDAQTQARLQKAAAALDDLPDDRPEDVRAKDLAFRRHEQTEEYCHKKQLADAWCAAFVIRKHFREPGREASVGAITQGHLHNVAEGLPLSVDLATEAERLSREYQFFHWHLAFPEVFGDGGFNCVLSNPPWVSYTGRQRAEVSDRFLRLLLTRFPCVARWPAAHPAFTLLATQLLAEGGRAGLVLPKQVADLAAYGGTREEVTAMARLASPVFDAGEDSFPGVTQPVGLFVIIVDRKEATRSQAPWPLATSATGGQAQSADSAVTAEVSGLPDLSALLGGRPRFLPKTFADPGVHTGNVSKKIILDTIPVDSSGYEPIREGRDIAVFVCGSPKKWLWKTPVLLQGEYCTIRPAERYHGVPILVRQTADRPVAARHRSPAYFRNSLLACLGVPNVPDTVVIAFLNSALYAWLHRAAAQDANQRAFPQVKVRHLHSLPGIPADAMNRVVDDRPMRDAIESAVLEAEAVAALRSTPPADILERIERMVLAAFDLSPDLAPALLEAVK